MSKCPHCEGGFFELDEVDATGAKYKHYFIQCSGCGAPFGVVEYENAGAILEGEIKPFLRELASDLRSSLSAIDNRLKRIEANQRDKSLV